MAALYLILGAIAVSAYIYLLMNYPAISIFSVAMVIALQVYSKYQERKEQALYTGENSRWLAKLSNEN